MLQLTLRVIDRVLIVIFNTIKAILIFKLYVSVLKQV